MTNNAFGIAGHSMATGQPRRAVGLSLIEVMIALLVLSIGLVGVAALHLTSLKAAHSSYYRSMSSTIALNIEERVWEEAREHLVSPGDCLSDEVQQSLLDEITGDWNLSGGESSSGWNDWTDFDSAGIPNLNVRFGTVEENSVTRDDTSNNGTWEDAWLQIPVRLTWTESRLEDDESLQTESFDYTVRIPCVSEFTPN